MQAQAATTPTTARATTTAMSPKAALSNGGGGDAGGGGDGASTVTLVSEAMLALVTVTPDRADEIEDTGWLKKDIPVAAAVASG